MVGRESASLASNLAAATQLLCCSVKTLPILLLSLRLRRTPPLPNDRTNTLEPSFGLSKCLHGP